MRTNPSIYTILAAAAVTGTLLLGGCAVTAVPDRVPLQTGAPEKNLNNVTLVVLNAGQDASPYPILTDKGVDVGYVGDRKKWSQKLTEALAGELARKGAVLRADGSLKLSVAVKEVTLVQTGEADQFKVKASVTSSSGWAKDYEASAETETGAFETVDTMARRLAGMSLAEVNKAILNDPEFQGQLNKR